MIVKKLLVIVAIVVVLSNLTFAQTTSPKRGICGDASPQDLATASPFISWYYDWGVAPPAVSQNQLSGIEWVPMCWGAVTSDKVATIEGQIPAGSKYLLGFNEPNFKSQSNLTPAQAAALWPNIEKIATDKGLKIVSPAVNWCGDCVDGVTYDPTDWLDKFFAACPGCKVDYIAIHNYSPGSAALSGYIDKFRKYNKPLWITEFAPWDPPKPDYDGVVQYMKEAIPILENDPIVFRYSWFATRVNSNHDIDLFDTNGKLSPLGKLYCSMPYAGMTADVDPVAIAGADISLNLPSTSTTLKGIAYDGNNDNITIEWSQVSGPNNSTISNNAIARPTITELVTGTYVFRMSVTANGKTDTDDVSVSVGATNIAFGKPISASSVENNATTATSANDGDPGTRWSSAFSDPQWLQIDLQSVYDITAVKISWEAAASKNYQIQVSDNGVVWSTAYTNSNGNGGVENIPLTVTGRYVRIYSTARTTQYGNSVYEFQVFGTLSQTEVTDIAAGNAFKVIPNPISNGNQAFRLVGIVKDGVLLFSVSDISGKVVFSRQVDVAGGTTADILIQPHLKSGIYFLILKDEKSTVQTKIIVQ